MSSDLKKVYEFFSTYPGLLKTATSTIAERLHVSESIVSEGRRLYKNDQKSSTKRIVTNANQGAEERITESEANESYEEFLERNNIDKKDVTNVWFKEKQSGTYFSVETRKYKETIDFDPHQAFRDSLKNYDIEDYTSLIPKRAEHSEERLAIINLFDAHLDKITATNTDEESSTIEDNISSFEYGFNELLLDIAHKNPERILIPLGNDFFHTNDSTLNTKRGTPQGDSVHITDIDAFRMGMNMLRKCIDKARMYAPVDLLFIRGNHDEDRVRYLLECLLVIYEHQEDVTVIDSSNSRQYYRYGTWLFGFAHGDARAIKVPDYPNLMMTDKEGKAHWSEITQAVYFLGHVHHENRFKFLKSKDFRGCKVEVLRAVSTTDEWHWNEGYIGIPKTAYAFIYEKDGSREHELKITL
jgi:hypothetical protein